MKRVLQIIAIVLALGAVAETVKSAVNGTLINNAYAKGGDSPGGV